ncbi:hypothetical protein BU25DRAFT_485846 [Macroventuria anomochaeta]|uniref:Uncharacterized protein n=1 Tax=Macroventuria anomochaeta TaxID=301207 RepID=A0ACB6S716_9PLEO|nr:uncharacterized protein BU25DRAFT_485846 [Macroventuria anomochaeta]KAF2629807.1 hypothetical protein BU25DRAFT_485846 [Macroventuria anomochaeta]
MPSYAELHQSPRGPGDARPTAMQIVKDNDLMASWKAKSCYSPESPKASESELPELSKRLVLELDMNSLASVRACAKEFLSKSSQLNIFITNAGIMMTPEGKTADGFEPQFSTNHIAHFLLFKLLKPKLLTSATPDFGSRVICLSSVSHRGSALDFTSSDEINFVSKLYDPVAAYAQSKLAAIYMANEIERRYSTNNLHAVVAKELRGRMEKYLEDCAVAEPAPAPMGDPTMDMGAPGYAAWAFNEGWKRALWKVSCGMVGVDKD